MAQLVCTRILDAGEFLIAIARQHVLVYNKSDGQLARSIQLGAAVRAITLDHSAQHIIAVDDNKKLQVLRFDTLDTLSTRTVAKKSTLVAVTPDGHTILLADKFGDIYSYPINPPAGDPAVAESDSKNEEGPAKGETAGTLILGHVSQLTNFLLSHDSRHIISSDRDEHIRISHYPLGYVIQSFCLGSTSFVTALHLLPSAPEVLISGGGEDVLRIWRWKDGQLLRSIDIGNVVRPHIAVSPPVLKKSRQPTKKRQKTDEHLANADIAAMAEDEKVLALIKIDSVHDIVVFCALGATALFYLRLPAEQIAEAPGTLQALDLCAPVLDFALDSSEPGRIWVSLDTQDGQPLCSVKVDTATSSLAVQTSPLFASFPQGERDPDIYLPLALLPKSPEDEGWAAAENASEPTSDKQRGRRKVKEQLKAIQTGAVSNL
ncbi:WD40 repeat-like protein [Auriculariales sp. MPI-PUGE-AT-0066]|nr:WD40 repeat-like protein [Auriculariales sp. MPI-PUGE-AT-0066]